MAELTDVPASALGPGRSISELHTARLRMRAVSPDDVAGVAKLSRDPRVNEHRPGGPPSQPESEAIARSFVDDWSRYGIGYWVVEYRGALVGVTGVKPVKLRGAECWNLYYRFSPAVWGQGIAAEAATAAIAIAHEQRPDLRVVARTRPDNTSAARLAVALGMNRAADLDGDGFIAFATAAPPASGDTVAL